MTGAVFALVLLAGRGEGTPPAPKGQRPLLVVMNEVVERLFPKFLVPPSPEARRLNLDPVTGRSWNNLP